MKKIDLNIKTMVLNKSVAKKFGGVFFDILLPRKEFDFPLSKLQFVLDKTIILITS